MRNILVAIFVFWSALPVSGQALLRTDTPAWVDIAEVPVMASELYRHVDGGENFLLVDRQVRWVGNVREIYIRVATEAVNRNGLESIATISRDFDPNIDSLTLVRLDIVRDGVRTDLRDNVVENIIRRETRLEQGILDGSLTAHISVPSVRVGDIVDAAFVWRSEEYFAGHNFSGRYQLEYAIPVALNRLIVHQPENQMLHLGETPENVEFKETQQSGSRRYEWIARNQQPQLIDDNTPAEYDPWAAVEYSAFDDWSDVAAPLVEYYNQAYSVPKMWRGQVDEIARTHDTPEARAFAALRLVQDNIRYVGMEVGAGGYFARSPESVVENAFGDCKDKSLLLTTILRDLGVDATVALVSLDQGYGVVNRLPSTQPFDHMIVGAKLDSGMFWMDPTASYQGGGKDTATEPDYGYVLPMDASGPGLVEISANKTPRHSREMTENFWFTFAGAFLSVETEFLGESANWQRDYWAATSVENIKTEYLTYYARNYPGIQAVAPPKMVDDRDANRISVTETYLIPRARLMELELLTDFPFISANSYDSYPDLIIGERRDPLAVQHSQKLVHKIRVRNAPIEFEAPDTSGIGGPAFDQSFTAKAWEGGNMDLTWSYQSRARTVPAKDVGQVVRDAQAARDNAAYSWDMRIDVN
ncbi:MAG: DUF3857 domain-containing transglutaminase family protein [Paracoccaceae bacterium]